MSRLRAFIDAVFRPRKQDVTPQWIASMEGFNVGEVVQHKLDDASRLVILFFYQDQYGGAAWCARSATPDDEAEYRTAELRSLIPPSPCPHCGLFGNHLSSCEYEKFKALAENSK